MYQDSVADMRKFHALERHHQTRARLETDLPEPQMPPKFITQPRTKFFLVEGQNAHFEAKLEPIADSNLRVEWLRNGKPITVGHRFRPVHDFGYVALDIVGVIEEDSGTYSCRAVNQLGETQFNLELQCQSKTVF